MEDEIIPESSEILTQNFVSPDIFSPMNGEEDVVKKEMDEPADFDTLSQLVPYEPAALNSNPHQFSDLFNTHI